MGVGGLDGFECKAEIVEDLRVAGGLGVEVGEEFEGVGEVSCGEGVVGLLDESGRGGGLGVGVVEVLRKGWDGKGNGKKKGGGAAEGGVRGGDRAARKNFLPPGSQACDDARGRLVRFKCKGPA